MEIKNRIIKSALVNWRSFLFIQSKSFKEFADVDYNKLRESVIKNQFVESFKVWQTKEGLYCLDGYHRCKILNDLADDGYNVPDKLHADFIECTGKKEAAKLVLIYSSIYAKPTYTGIQDFLAEYDLNIADINAEIDLPEIDINLLNTPIDADWASMVESTEGKGRSDMVQVTFILNNKDIPKLKDVLSRYDPNKDTALMRLIAEVDK